MRYVIFGLFLAVAVGLAGADSSSAPTTVKTEEKPVLGCYFQTKSFHVMDGPCIKYLTGFRVVFPNADGAVSAGYQPCDFCSKSYQSLYNRKVAAIQRRWTTFVRTVDAAASAAGARDAAAAFSEQVGTVHAITASVLRKEAKTSYGAAGLALLAGQRRAAQRLAVRGASEKALAAEEDAAAEAWYAEMARQEYLANFNRQYALKAQARYLEAANKYALSEMQAERQALEQSVSLLAARDEPFQAAMTAGLHWMVTLTVGSEDEIRASAALMEKAIVAYRDEARPDDPTWVNTTLGAAYDLGTHGHPAYGMLASFLVKTKYPDNSRASQVYLETYEAWTNR
ncbi:MAG: hypothetical protein ACYC63_18750 [Armatimonadota bacterium]